VALVSPPAAQAQASLIGAIQSVLNVINGLIQTAMNSINSVRAAISNFYQQVTWPVTLINQAQAMVTQMIGQYRSLMQSIFNINLKSATLPNPVALENVMQITKPMISEVSRLPIATHMGTSRLWQRPAPQTAR
jgi:hypothetical protein